jgi:hypothetical protein
MGIACQQDFLGVRRFASNEFSKGGGEHPDNLRTNISLNRLPLLLPIVLENANSRLKNNFKIIIICINVWYISFISSTFFFKHPMGGRQVAGTVTWLLLGLRLEERPPHEEVKVNLSL